MTAVVKLQNEKTVIDDINKYGKLDGEKWLIDRPMRAQVSLVTFFQKNLAKCA